MPRSGIVPALLAASVDKEKLTEAVKSGDVDYKKAYDSVDKKKAAESVDMKKVGEALIK